MCRSSHSTTHSRRSAYGSNGKSSCTGGNWSAANIAAMVIGFVVFWPVGLLILFWNISGRDIRDLPAMIRRKWSAVFGGTTGVNGRYAYSSSENSVFDEYQDTQYDRIKEIKEEIKHRAERFREFRSNARRRAEEKEFNDFMSSNPGHEKE